MPGLSYHDGTAKRNAIAIAFHDGTAKRTIVAGWYNDGVASRKFWPAQQVQLSARDPYASFTPPGQTSGSASITLANDGTYFGNVSPSGFGGGFYPNWLLSGAANLYSVRWTPTSGSASPDSGAANTWLNLGTTRSFSIAGAPPSTKFITGLLEIRLDSSGAILASANVSLTVERVV